jgi:membrane-bound metal-dependent hydrolase YbcI (DUF457 family)
MGRTHALSGGAGWLASCAVLTAVGHAPHASTVIVGGLISAGFALLPDVDHPQSTIARTLGPVTGLISVGVSAGAVRLRVASCSHCADRPARGGHRQVTHTAVFAVALGLVVGVAGWLAGARAGLPVVWIATGLAARAMLTRRQRGALGAVLLASFVTAVVYVTAGPSWWWIGVPVAWGTLAHSLGDAATRYGAPLVWPVRIRGCRWARVGTPGWARFSTGGLVERAVWVLLLVGTVGGFGYVLGAG